VVLALGFACTKTRCGRWGGGELAERDIPTLVQILRGISPRRVGEMQLALEAVRTRFAFWVPLLDAAGDVQRPDPLHDRAHVPDALSTIMDVLRFKLVQRLANHTSHRPP
jgi:hypothetical protein